MKKTVLYNCHKDYGARIISFAGYEMPIHYSEGIIYEHKWVRSGNVGVFDVSHMLQILIEGIDASRFISKITPSCFAKSKLGLSKYTIMINENGGIIDDLIISKISENKFYAVLNAACREKDLSWMNLQVKKYDAKITPLEDRSLIAVQGEKSLKLLEEVFSYSFSNLSYMNIKKYESENFGDIFIGRSGYTGEDGFELSISNKTSCNLWTKLCQSKFAKPIGLGARDSLRLEVGYPLYGNDLDEKTSPIESKISWVINKNNNSFIGYNKVKKQMMEGVQKKRVGINLVDKGVLRNGFEILDTNKHKIGIVTSGGFSPTLKTSIGQGYIQSNYKKEYVYILIRGRLVKAQLSGLIFVKQKTRI